MILSIIGFIFLMVVAFLLLYTGIFTLFGAYVFSDKAGMIVGIGLVCSACLFGWLFYKLSPFEIVLRSLT